MSKIFFAGFFMLLTSTIAFIVAILTPFWIIKSSPWIRGIFQVCDRLDPTNSEQRLCGYILFFSTNQFIINYRTDYAIACAWRSIVAGSIALILVWISGIHMCIKGKINQHGCMRKRTTEFLIAGTLLADGIIVVTWVVMLVKNLDSNNVITTSQIGWSLWLAVGSTGGFLIATLFFCIHRIDLGLSHSKRSSPYNNSGELLQRF